MAAVVAAFKRLEKEGKLSNISALVESNISPGKGAPFFRASFTIFSVLSEI
jgi:hypothetical protein